MEALIRKLLVLLPSLAMADAETVVKMDPAEEAKLINHAKSGDPSAFEQLVRQNYGFVYKVAFKWCRIKEDSEDITQDVFIKLARNITSFREDASFKTWLYRITINTAKDLAIKNQRLRKKESAYLEMQKEKRHRHNPETSVTDRLIGKIESLPPKLKDAALLVYSEGLTHKEAAEVLKCAETTVSWRIFQVRKQLKRFLESGELT